MTTLNAPNSADDLTRMQQSLRGRLAALRAKVRMRIALDALVRGLWQPSVALKARPK